MPQVIQAVATFLVTAWTGGYGATVAFLTKVAASALLALASSRLFAPRLPEGAGLSGHSVTKRSALEYRKLVYGEAMISGPIVYTNLNGQRGQYLWYVIALSEGLSDSVTAVWLDGDEIPAADIDWDGTSGTGDVSTAKWVGANSTKAIQIWYHLGADSQAVDTALNVAFPDIGANHRLRGVTYIITKFLYDSDTELVWEAGVPNDIKVLVKGLALYDPRLDTTQIIDATTSPVTMGSGTHRTADATTWAWSDNPALCVAHYLLDIMGVDASYIDWPSIAKAADDCEVQVVTSPVASPENQEDRFTCNGIVSLGASHKDNLDVLLSSCDGMLGYTGGTWKMRASVWEASSVTLDEDDIAGGINVRGSAAKSDRFNTVRGFFIDPDRKYESVEFPHVTDSNYVTRDNGKTISADLQLPMTNSEGMAQRIAFRQLNKSDNQIICELKLNARGAKIAIGDVVSLTVSDLSWSAKTFRCIGWARNGDGTFGVTLQEDSATTYTDPAVGDYSTTNVSGVTIPADVMPPPTALTATGGVGGIRLDWTNPPNATYDYIDVYEDTNNSWTGSGLIASVRANSFFVPRASGTTYYYWVRAVRSPDLESDRSPDSDTTTVSGAATAGGGGTDGDSVFYATVYIRNNGTPTTPTTDDGEFNFTTQTLTPPAGWSATVPSPGSPTYPVYSSHGVFSISGVSGTDSTVTWSTPGLLAEDGAAGTSPVVSQLTNSAVVVSADHDGTNYSLTSAGGTHQVSEGGTDVTTSAAHTVVGETGSPLSVTQNGLSISVGGTTGVYALSGASWTSDGESFTLRANYGGTNYDKVYTIAKSKAGSPSNISLVGATLSNTGTDPTSAKVSYRLTTTGKEYTEQSAVSGFVFLNNFLLSGSIGDYECRMVDLGTGTDTPTGSSVDTWLACSTERTWTLTDNSIAGGDMTFNGRIEVRLASTQVEQDTALVSLTVNKAF